MNRERRFKNIFSCACEAGECFFVIPVELSIIFTLRSWPAKGMGKKNSAPSYLEEVWLLLKARRAKFSLILASLLLDFHILALWGGGRFALIKTRKAKVKSKTWVSKVISQKQNKHQLRK